MGRSGPSPDKNIELLGPVTASGNISSSGTIFTDEISSPSNNLIISSSTVKITATTDGEANLILESDSDNNDENDNPFMLFTQDGGAINGYMGLTGDADKWPDGGTLTGATANALVLGTKGPTTSTNSQLFLVAGDSASLRVENDADIHIYENLNVTKTISVADTSVVDYGITNADTLTFGRANRPTIFQGTSFNAQTSITASGDISSSGTVTANSLVGTLATAAQTNITSVGTLGSLTVSGDITANGNIVGDDSTNITNIATIECDSVTHDGDTDTKISFGTNAIRFTAGNVIGVDFTSFSSIFNLPVTASGHISASGTVYTNKVDFNPANSYDYIAHDDTRGVHIKSNDSKITLIGNVTASGHISASGDIMAGGTIQAGWHGSTTRIKILVSDFIPDDIGRPAMIDDSGSDRWLESHGTGILFASLPIPTGFKATHVHIYGSGTSALEVSEMNINSKTVTSKGTGNIGTELDITDVTSSTTNYLLLELAQASGEEVYGGYVTIVAV